MKKVLATALLCAVSSFASWDYFAPKDAGKGEAKLSEAYCMPAEKSSNLDLRAGARYSIIERFEASLILPINVMQTIADQSNDNYAGLTSPIVGLRYFLPMGLGFFADLYIPFDSHEGVEPDFNMVIGPQFSMKANEQLSFGTEIRVENLITDPDVDLGLGLEVDYSIGSSTPFLGVELGRLLSDADMSLDVIIGYTHDISEALSASASVGLGLSGYGDDNMPITIGASVSFNF
ncbi:MAG: hypothetical protein LBH25_06325 [Fibromonadaceae bacterium]|jgi:hypothetical protein|nr:hypothetical protein [Fibromonadaceae bacterium]